MRRSAWVLRVNRKTVARKLKFLAARERLFHEQFLATRKSSPIFEVQFDEMETFEHTKCKPLSLPLIVESKTRKILGIRVASMPAKGHLAAISRKKYGLRKDERAQKMTDLFSSLKDFLPSQIQITSDENPHYPKRIKKAFPDSLHFTVKGRRSSLGGQGELKKIGFDPIFSLNHTAAMIRAHLSRMFRRTWCATKDPSSLFNHLMLYLGHHNRERTA